MELKQKLLNIQNELKAPKSQFNSFGKYNYRNCEDILEAVKPLCKKHNAVVTLSDEIVLVGERYYIKATAQISDTEKADTISVCAYAREEESKKGMDGSQVTGASSSYARKYALNGLFNIDDTKDSDGTNKGDNDTEKPKAQPKQDKPKPSINLESVAKYFDVSVDKLTDEMKSMALKQKSKEISMEELAAYRQELNYDS